MTESITTQRQQQLLRELCRLAADRAEAELRICARRASENDAVMAEYQAARDALAANVAEQRVAVDAKFDAARTAAVAQYRATHDPARAEYDRVCAAIQARCEAAQQTAEQRRNEARWEAQAVFEATKANAAGQLQATLKTLEATKVEMDGLRRAGQELYDRRRPRWWGDRSPALPPEIPDGPVREPPESCVAVAHAQLKAFHDHQLPLLFLGPTPVLLLLALWLAAIWPAGALLGWQSWTAVLVSGGASLVAWAALATWLVPIAKQQTATDFRDLQTRLAEAELACQAARQRAQVECRQKLELVTQQRDAELNQAERQYAQTMAELTATKDHDLRVARATYPPQWAEAARRRDEELARLETDERAARQQIETRYQAESLQVTQSYECQMTASQRESQRQWDAMATIWQTGVARFHGEIDAMNRTCDALFPPWDAAVWHHWQPREEIPPIIRFGAVKVDLARIETGMPSDATLRPPQTVFSMPAVVPFPDHPSLLLHVRGKAASHAIPVMHNFMLRMLTTIPPGRLRLTIVDPIGLGANFAAFMHLADFDEQLITRRIWTESGDIERRLADLTEHMETIIQKYLRNQFASIGQYNAQAGEVAEPFHLLVVADFPAGFTETAARRLTRLIVSGPRCGVFTLMCMDHGLEWPPHFELAGVEPHATNLVWKNGLCVWREAGLGNLPLTLDHPPHGDLVTDVVRAVGARANEANRVEVPFARIAPAEDAWWSAESSSEIAVPLGRAGATELQHLRLGKGTSQHVLIAGKTGAGKSTLLHVLVTNLALRYEPAQVEFYLVDFKKGVEFKPYARFHLPHARVIAIESEREFGLSVLQRLDAELKHRGDRFRGLGVQDLAGFRTAAPTESMPRVLLIIDEFQELFVEDDMVAQTAALLLDRLVRQGRAFGIHVLLGSQTLAGAYSLARSTIGQMAVRIALECSESDAHLILSEENRAARLLSRPGQAIYNDGNGMAEQNQPFQVAWLGDAEREATLKRLERYAKQRGADTPPAVVFEGNLPADLAHNGPLAEMLAESAWPNARRSANVWLGAAVAIKPPTSAIIRRQSGSNLLMVGQQPDAALGILASCLVSLAVQHPPSADDDNLAGGPLIALCGEPPNAWQTGYFADLCHVLPQRLTVAGLPETETTIASLTSELTRRRDSAATDAPPIYLLIYNLARFRALRKADDEFGLASLTAEKEASVAEQFGEILSEGPVCGIHTLIWCDSGNHVQRFLSRQMLRDIELRVLFQVSETDSTNLIDSPAAGRLGVSCALLYNAEQGSLEKFRPYRPPSRDWLDTVHRALQRRVGNR